MKRYILMILAAVWLLAGCGAQEQQPIIDLPELIQQQTQPTTYAVPEETEIAAEESTISLTEYYNDVRTWFAGLEIGFGKTIHQYSGSEMSVQISYFTSDHNVNPYWNFGDQSYHEVPIGVFLFLDGQLQPYRTCLESEYSYMHTFIPLGQNVVSTETFYFTPVTGQAGDELELQVMCVIWPDYFVDQGALQYQHTSYMSGNTTLIQFQADAEAWTVPQVPDRVLNVTTETTDLKTPYTDFAYENHVAFLYTKDGGEIYNITDLSEPVKMRYEIKGDPAGLYTLAVFVDNVPVSVSEEDIIYIQPQDGKQTAVTITLDLSDYDGQSVVYLMLVPRNCLSGGTRTWHYPIPAYYISSAQNLEELLGIEW